MSLRDQWKKAKAEVAKNLVLSQETEKQDLGPLLDKMEAAEKEFDKLDGVTEDQNKLKKAKLAVALAIEDVAKVIQTYSNALQGIMKARPEQAASARKLQGMLNSIGQYIINLKKKCPKPT